jgi:hypothetical protein
MENFYDCYPEKEVVGDTKEVEKLKKTEEKITARGKLLESLLSVFSESSNWFGENCHIILLSDYDDRMAHGDIVLEMKNDKGELSQILIDITTSIDESNLKKKIGRSYNGDGSVKLSNIKYYESEAEETKGPLLDIPRVVMGISPETLGILCEDIKEKGRRQENNMVQLLLLDQVFAQLITMRNKANNPDKKDELALKKTALASKIISTIIDRKKSLHTRDYELKANSDLTHQQILSASF